MNKVIKYSDEARDSIVKGIDAVADIVKLTVGPKGRNVLIRNQISTPIITNDGVTIAKSVQLKDNAEDAGAALIISAANKTNDVAGDGTTTTTILAQQMIKEYYNNYATTDSKINVVQIQKDMIKASNEISDYLKTSAIPVTDIDSIQRVASISSGNEEIGYLISKAFELAGEYGSVIVEDSKNGKDGLENIQGMKLMNGTVSPYLLNDKINMKSNILDADVLVTSDKIDNIIDLMPILDFCIKSSRKLLILCDDIEMEPLNTILMNKAKGLPLNVSIVRLPGFGELRNNLIEDICIATGATCIGRDNGNTLKDFTPEFLGEVDEATITMDDTILKFKDTLGRSNVIGELANARQQRVQELEAAKQRVEGEDKKQYERRISNLLSGIVVINVGGNSEVEIKDKKLRIEDAINSVQAAKEEGIVPGGGFSFISAYKNRLNDKREFTIGESIVYKSILSVTKQIAENAGFVGDDILKECLEQNKGFNALTEQFENLLETGVINSVKVDRYGLINATSVASTVITMGGLIVDENEKDQNILQLQTESLPSLM